MDKSIFKKCSLHKMGLQELKEEVTQGIFGGGLRELWKISIKPKARRMLFRVSEFIPCCCCSRKEYNAFLPQEEVRVFFEMKDTFRKG